MATVTLKAKEGAAPGFRGFLGWLAAVHPRIYNAVAVSTPEIVAAIENDNSPGSRLGNLSPAPTVNTGSGEFVSGSAVVPGTGAASSMQSLITTITQAGAAYLSLDQQKRVLAIQLDRARRGLPPLDVGAYMDPNQGVNVGINQGTQRTLLYLVGGLGAVFLLSRLLKR